MLRNYDPGRVVIIWGPITFLAHAAGVFASVERNSPAFKTTVGAAGDVTRTRNRDKTGMFKWTGQAMSPTNDQLSDVAIADELVGGQVYPLTIADLNGTTLVDAASCWIEKMPTVEFGDEASDREWSFSIGELNQFTGGSLV